jgi:diguanylate cyclase (GGDEF)-like protein/PAS domain S-box-containing protein
LSNKKGKTDKGGVNDVGRWTIGVLTPLLDGFYYGDMIWGISRGAKLHSLNVMAVTTATYKSSGESLNYNERIGWDRVDVWIIVANAVSADYARMLSQTGKPIVTVANRYPGIAAHVVQCDNRGGAAQSTRHLIELGHRSIAFVGDASIPDFKERFEGYRDALHQSGIPYDERLFYNVYVGEEGARRLIADGMPATAVVAAADWQAAAMMDVFRKYGIRIPDDVAVIGFDDGGIARNCKPTLSTVRQPIIDLGFMAANCAVQALSDRERAESPGATLIPARLILRESSGSGMNDLSANEQTLTWDDIPADELEELIESHYQIMLSVINTKDLSWLRWTSQHWGCLGLWSANSDGGERLLAIDKTFSARGGPLPPVGEMFREEQFPPLPALPTDPSSDRVDLVVVQPVYSNHHDWGWIATIGPVSERMLRSYETRKLPPMIGIINENTALVEDLSRRESMNASLVEKLEIVSRTSNDGVYDCDLVAGRIEWITGIEHILGSSKGELPHRIEDLEGMVHPEDSARVGQAWKKSIEQRRPFKIEFRLKRRNDYIWVVSAGEALFDSAGRPERFIGSVTDITERKRAEEQIQYLAYHDSLTGLANRRFFYEKLTEAIRNSRSHQAKIAVMLIDLDKFKIINDSLGHDMGDLLLQHVSRKLVDLIGGQGLVARIGGDEFMVMMPDVGTKHEAERMACEIVELLQQPFNIDGIDLYATASLGLCWFPDNAQDIGSLIKMADTAMYRAKHRGRNRAESYYSSMDADMNDRLLLESRLRKAAASMTGFTLYYQPLIEIGTGRMLGMEALLRWQDAEGGDISPKNFIPVAEENGLIVPIGNWALREACRQWKAWEAEGVEVGGLAISVNLSAAQLQQADLLLEVDRIVSDTGIAPERICFEITETAALQNLDYSVGVLRELALRGFRIALDDFGTGYSSLSLVKQLPIHTIKIDRTFVGDIGDRDNAAIVSAIIAMSKSLGLTVLAEGVETEEQLSMLRRMGCDAYQGYLSSKPVPAEEIKRMFAKLGV